MKKLAKILLPLLLVLVILAGCGGKGNETDGTGDGTSAETTPKQAEFMITDEFHIVCDNDDDEASVAGLYLKKAIEAVYGITIPLETDYKCPVYDHEFRIGKTNREEKTDVISALADNTFYYGVLSDKIIVLSGANGNTTLEAVKAFCRDCLGYVSENDHGEAKAVKCGIEFTYDYEYPIKNFTINGTDVRDFVILNTNTTYSSYAAKIASAIEKMTGYRPKLYKAKKDVPDGKRLICFDYLSVGNKGVYSYSYEKDKDGNLLIRSAQQTTVTAITEFIKSYLTEYPSISYDLDFTEKDVRYDVGSEDNGLVLQKTTEKQVCAGVKYSTLNYTDKNGKPVIACVLTIEPGAATPYMATPKNALPFKAWVIDTPIHMATYAEENLGFDICCGVNGDLAENGLPMAMNVRDGKKYSEPRGFPMFGVNKDGSFFTGYYEDLKSPNQLQTAVGGRFMLLRDGLIYDIGHNIDFSYVRHPRTAVGFDKEGRLYIVEVDGRQPSWSNGASLADLALIFLHLGATDAVNIDGGGSSMMYYKDYKTNQFVAETKSSDGTYRNVVNSLFFIRNANYGETEK